MKALILCGGLGTRLRPLTNKTPKPMIEVGNKPVLEHIANNLNDYGIKDIIVNVHYLPHKIIDYFKDRFIYSYEENLLGEDGTLKRIKSWVGNDYLWIVNGDTLTNLNLSVMKNELNKYPVATEIRFTENKVFAGWRLCRDISEPALILEYENDNYYWIDMGTPEGLKKARERYGDKTN